MYKNVYNLLAWHAKKYMHYVSTYNHYELNHKDRLEYVKRTLAFPSLWLIKGKQFSKIHYLEEELKSEYVLHNQIILVGW